MSKASMKRITITLTEDQHRAITEMVANMINSYEYKVNHGKRPSEQIPKQLAFLIRLMTVLQLAKS